MQKMTLLPFAGLLALTTTASSVRAQNMFVDTSTTIYEYQNGVQSTFATGLSGLSFMNFDNAGDLFAVSGTSIIKFANTGGALSSSPTIVVTGLKYYSTFPDSLAFDTAGNMYVNDSGSTVNPFSGAPLNTAKTYKFTFNSSTGGFNQSTLSSVYLGTLFSPQGQIAYHNGDLYEPENYGGGVGIFSAGSVTRNTIVSDNGSVANLTVGGEGLAVDSLGNMYVSIYIGGGNGSIMKIAAGANGNTVPTTFVSGSTALNDIRSLNFDANGDLFATAANSILEFVNTDGVLSTTPIITSLPGANALAFEPEPIPEPTTLALFGIGAISLLGRRYRRG